MYRRANKTLRRTFLSNRAAISLTRPLQESKDVEEKLGALIPWLTKLKESLTATRADDDSEDAEGLRQLTRFASHIYRPTDQG